MAFGTIGQFPSLIRPAGSRDIGYLGKLGVDHLPIWDGNRAALSKAVLDIGGLPVVQVEKRIVRNELSAFDTELELVRFVPDLPYAHMRIQAGQVPLVVPFVLSYDAPEKLLQD